MNVKRLMVTNVLMADEEFRRRTIRMMRLDLIRKGHTPKRIRFERVPEPKTGKHFQPKWRNFYIEVFYD